MLISLYLTGEKRPGTVTRQLPVNVWSTLESSRSALLTNTTSQRLRPI